MTPPKSIIKVSFSLFFCVLSFFSTQAQSKSNYNVIAYFSGSSSAIGAIKARNITHLIYCFCSLRGNRLFVSDNLTIKKLVGLRKVNPSLKILLSLGGWGGCRTCSDVFASPGGRHEFALSVKATCERLGTDGIDLDWEYPAIEGFPGHKYTPEDRTNFTLLVQELRQVLGSSYEISFAAGGFQKFLETSIDWVPVMQVVDRVNIMSYDLVNGYSIVTGHHTALYSTPQLRESADNAVQYLLRLGIPSRKIAIGAAFYARVWQNVPNINNGLYQPGIFKNTVAFKNFISSYTAANGFIYHWDDTAKAPFLYHPSRKLFVTFDNNESVRLKTEYVMQNHLNGIMFWQIAHDRNRESLLGTINETLHGSAKAMVK